MNTLTKIINIVSITIIIAFNLYAIAINFLFTMKAYDDYSYSLPDAWQIFIFPILVLVFFIIGILLLVKKSSLAYLFLVLPLICYLLVDFLHIDVDLLDTDNKYKSNAVIEYLTNNGLSDLY